MPDNQPTLLLTRPEPQSREFLAQCEARIGRRLPSVISPAISIEPVGDLPQLDKYASLIFTSGNGVRSVLASDTLAGRLVFTVGEKTAELARNAGADAEALGEDVEAFLENAHRVKGPALFCRGVHSRGNLAERLGDAGVRVDQVVLYEQASRPLSQAALQLLSGEAPVVAPVFSPRTARLLSAYGVITAPISVIAMSEAVAEAWTGGGEIKVAKAPNSDAMCDLTLDIFQSANLGL